MNWGMQRTAVVSAALLGLACDASEEPSASGMEMSKVVSAPERAGNLSPSVEHVTLSPERPRQGDPIEATIETSDPNDDALRLQIEWRVEGRLVEGATRTRLKTGDYQKGDQIEIRVVATDGLLESAPYKARTVMANRAPLLQGVGFASQSVRPGEPIEAGPVASDPDGDALHFQYVWHVNGKETTQRGERFDTTGLARGDRVLVEVTATDFEDETKPIRSSEVVMGNSPPEFVGVPTAEDFGGEFRYAFEARDGDGDKLLRYRLVQAPRGMTIDATTGVARWRPDSTQAGSHVVEVFVQDAIGDATALRFNVSVQVGPGPGPAAGRR